MTMDWVFCIFLYLFCAFQSVLMFNIDPVTWKFFTRNNDVGFGYRVIQRDTSSLLVSDPLVQYSSNARGQVYSCVISQETCLPVPINVPSEAVNMSLGLFMTKDTQSSNSVDFSPYNGQGRVDCRSLDGMQGVSAGETICRINNPLFAGNTSAVFHIIYSINKESHFDQTVTFSASVTSGNTNHSENSELLKMRNINIKHAIYVALLRHTDSSIYINFTSGKNNLGKPVKQILEVKNEFRELNLTVFIRVPVKLGAENIWADNKLKNCSVAVCAVFRCDVNLMRNERKFYNISSNVSSGWIEQIGVRSASFELVSTASLSYDEEKYTYFSDTLSSAPVCEVNTQVEVYEEPSLLKEVTGGVIGGLLTISLITAILYKSGFFKRKAKQQIKDPTQEADELEYLDRN